MPKETVTLNPADPSSRDRRPKSGEESRPRWASWRSWLNVGTMAPRPGGTFEAKQAQWPRRRRCSTIGRWKSTRCVESDAPDAPDTLTSCHIARVTDSTQLTFIIKQDLSSLNEQIRSLQALSKRLHPKPDQEGENNKNILLLLQGKLGDVSANFKVSLVVLCLGKPSADRRQRMCWKFGPRTFRLRGRGPRPLSRR